MKILRGILLLAGIFLIAYGLCSLLFPQYITVNGNENNQILGLMGLGILALLAAVFAKNLR